MTCCAWCGTALGCRSADRAGAAPTDRARASAAARACRSPRRRGAPAARGPCESPRRETGTPQDGADLLDVFHVAEQRLGPALGRRLPRRRRGPRVHRRPRQPVRRADHRQRVAPARARTAPLPHALRLLHSTVKPLFSMRSSANSRRIISSPIFARAPRSAPVPRLRRGAQPPLTLLDEDPLPALELVRRHLALP